MRRGLPSPLQDRIRRCLRQHRMSTFNVDALHAPVRLYKGLDLHNALKRHAPSKSGVGGYCTIDEPSFSSILALGMSGNNAQYNSEEQCSNCAVPQ